MVREQRTGKWKEYTPKARKKPKFGRRKGRHSKKDIAKDKQERIWKY